ncbi:hypothetical protein EYC80_001200 [Monilinia laxa]|uniref:Uncharacterized protein n=1 Tax=Monilinia laxa TaxID=61186 RepID=A0A5N6K8F7_MONLA|nr:hypothetical protein EYC80_001200 [Monilinia laxa]
MRYVYLLKLETKFRGRMKAAREGGVLWQSTSYRHATLLESHHFTLSLMMMRNTFLIRDRCLRPTPADVTTPSFKFLFVKFHDRNKKFTLPSRASGGQSK